jgi:hypothetical protein
MDAKIAKELNSDFFLLCVLRALCGEQVWLIAEC